MENKSHKYQLNAKDFSKILNGLFIALGGALLVFVAEIIPMIDFGNFTPLAVALASVLVNAGRKWLKDYSVVE